MGFETTVVISIFFVSVLVLGTNSYAVMSSSNDVISDAEDIRYEMQYNKLNSAVSPGSMTLDNESSILMIEVTNSGSVVLDSDEISMLMDGYLLNYDYYPETAKWYPGETKIFAVEDISGSASKRVKIVTDSGVAGYIGGVPGSGDGTIPEIDWEIDSPEGNTDEIITIDSMKSDKPNSILIVEATNHGDEVLYADELSILVDGKVKLYSYSPDTRTWYSGETKTFAIEGVSGSAYMKVEIITDSGISASFSGIPEK
ncbi:Archaellum component FlaF, FlaF/FlaG flagellin family [Methanococcoides vulcani]|uniref:Archaellum component FlaF, FlaF/FlaG flagellin family n=1 Tax=Methanococcoides vulcani TaxID=1353158 RepID=A0A1I0ANC7_9EURY|nr:hypothetical protein [Methanococcoides vulcani]SES95668.1 Archaellum component FlaF, FlaF/FlaG flagellin family [Methanococcoides vulcani]